MNKKIMIFILSLFGALTLLATIFFFSNKNEDVVKNEEPKVVEPQNRDSYVKISDTDLSSSKADVHILIKYSLGLYAKATDNLEIDNVPINDLETNSKEFYKAIIVRYSYDELIVQKDDLVYRFYRIGD